MFPYPPWVRPPRHRPARRPAPRPTPHLLLASLRRTVLLVVAHPAGPGRVGRARPTPHAGALALARPAAVTLGRVSVARGLRKPDPPMPLCRVLRELSAGRGRNSRATTAGQTKHPTLRSAPRTPPGGTGEPPVPPPCSAGCPPRTRPSTSEAARHASLGLAPRLCPRLHHRARRAAHRGQPVRPRAPGPCRASAALQATLAPRQKRLDQRRPAGPARVSPAPGRQRSPPAPLPALPRAPPPLPRALPPSSPRPRAALRMHVRTPRRSPAGGSHCGPMPPALAAPPHAPLPHSGATSGAPPRVENSPSAPPPSPRSSRTANTAASSPATRRATSNACRTGPARPRGRSECPSGA